MTDLPRILIVEDDSVAAEALAQAVRDIGAAPTIQTTFPAGIAEAETGAYGVIVFDRMLPGGDGIDAIAKLRSAGSTALVMVVSALGRAANKIEGLEKGADDYLAKPFDPDELYPELRGLAQQTDETIGDARILPTYRFQRATRRMSYCHRIIVYQRQVMTINALSPFFIARCF